MINLILIILARKGIITDRAARKLAEELRTRAIPDNYDMALSMLDNLITRSEKSLERRVYVPEAPKKAPIAKKSTKTAATSTK